MKKLWNIKVTVIPIVIGAFGMVTKGLLKDLEDLEVGGREETIQTTALLNTEKSPQTPVKDHQLTMMKKLSRRKTRKRTDYGHQKQY